MSELHYVGYTGPTDATCHVADLIAAAGGVLVDVEDMGERQRVQYLADEACCLQVRRACRWLGHCGELEFDEPGQLCLEL